MRFVSAKKGGINTKVPLINQKTEILQSTQNRKPLDSLLNQGGFLFLVLCKKSVIFATDNYFIKRLKQI